MSRKLRRFLREEKGAVTVDWVVLTAAVCGLIAVTYIAYKDSSDNLANQTSIHLSNKTVGN